MPNNRNCNLDLLRILKEYIEGPTIYDLVRDDLINDEIIKSVENMARKCFEHNLNIDYYPTNFIVGKEKIYYIDYLELMQNF